MIRILLTGDLHLGKNYQKEEPGVMQRYREARIQALENAVTIASRERCDYFVIAGDLYDKLTGIADSLHEQVCQILSRFSGETVLILPGNHDYYAPKDTFWKKFEEYSGSNVRVFRNNEKYQDGNVIFYPCICHDKISKNNALAWLSEETERDSERYHIGIAHGALEGLSYDKNQEYYLMTQQELLDCHMDAWLIGHTHVAYPPVFDNTVDQRIFNAGTPQQTDIADGSAGEVFILEIGDDKKITAKREQTGVIRFVKKTVVLQHGQELEEALQFPDLEPASTSLRVELSGTALAEDYDSRSQIYEKLKNRYIKAEINDEKLRKEITPEMVSKETVEGSVLNRLLNSYLEDSELLNLAYDLAISCKEGV